MPPPAQPDEQEHGPAVNKDRMVTTAEQQPCTQGNLCMASKQAAVSGWLPPQQSVRATLHCSPHQQLILWPWRNNRAAGRLRAALQAAAAPGRPGRRRRLWQTRSSEGRQVRAAAATRETGLGSLAQPAKRPRWRQRQQQRQRAATSACQRQAHFTRAVCASAHERLQQEQRDRSAATGLDRWSAPGWRA